MVERESLIQARKNAHTIGLILLIITLSPSFPNLVGRSLLPSIITLTTYSLLVAYLFISKKLIIKTEIILFWILQYVFLLSTALPSDENIIPSDFTELLIPLSSIFITIYLYSIFKETSEREILEINKIIYRYICFIILIILSISILEFIELEINILYILYKPYEKYLGSTRVVTFFLYPYYLTFFLLTALCFILPVMSYTRSLFSFIIFLCTLTAIILAQSQSGFTSALLITFLYFFINNPNYINLFIRSAFLILIVIASIYLAPISIKWLASNFDLYTFRAMNRIINSPETSGTLNVRLNQIIFAIQESYNNYLIVGAGWGRNAYLESWISYLIHKYGVLYTFLLVLGWAYMIYKLFIKYKLYYQERSIISYYLKSFLVFIAVLPISLSSAFLLFTHKLTLLFYFIIMLSLHIIDKPFIKKKTNLQQHNSMS